MHTAPQALPVEWWLVVDTDRILEIDSLLAQFLGYTPEQMIGTRWKQYVHAEDLPDVSDASDSMYNSTLEGFISRWRRSDSTFVPLRWFTTRWLPSIDEEGHKLSPRALLRVEPSV